MPSSLVSKETHATPRLPVRGRSRRRQSTKLSPTLTLPLPLKVDACTRVFYGGVGTGLLAGFLGTIDGAGYGRAKLTVPSGIKGSVTGHFAAVVFDKSTGYFKRVTNAVGFTFK